ncbi:protein of unknown function [Bryocella elongata]|uniref:DUF4350 domain-containing protein n=1 Tax=Bryocella elongata TaxID=863522 RepID=A0A1H6AF16_9BACT|nr:DUF4350 domain-containing protein [Bryocella elongata]SEG47343.1 protein of unknown function [Bryocella elongata]
MSYRVSRRDKWMLGSIAGVTLVLVIVIALLAPASSDNDPRPTTMNAGDGGAKAAYLMLQALGVPTERWERPMAELSDADAPHTTLILADPSFTDQQGKELASELHRFLEHGGRVITTGWGGAQLLDGKVEFVGQLAKGLCLTTPEGPGELAAAGHAQFQAYLRWAKPGPQYRVEQRCGLDPVVVRFSVIGKSGVGEAIWWTEATPLTNGGLKDDANLRLFLASLGPDLGHGRRVYFDESLRTVRESLWDYARGLPLTWLVLQAMAVGALLLFSFSRRRGPLRLPVTLPRSSPVEFAESMGDLYEKAGARIAAIGAARRRLDRVLTREAGLPQAVLAEGPTAIAASLSNRLGGEWTLLRDLLEQAAEADEKKLTPRSTLHLVRGIHEQEMRLHAILHPTTEMAAQQRKSVAPAANSSG